MLTQPRGPAASASSPDPGGRDPAHEAPAQSIQTIEPVTGFALPNLRELGRHFDLMYFLVRRDVAVRYKQTVVGVAWSVLQPLLLAIIFSVFLGSVASVPSGAGVPYPVFAVSGLSLWICFSSGLLRASDSLVTYTDLVSKVYFPRLVIPIAAVIPPVVDFGFAFIVVLLTMAVYGVAPSPLIVFMPFVVLLSVSICLGASLWLSALNVRYRDISMLVPFVVQVGLFVTPIIYPASLLPDRFERLYALNPLVGVFQLYRWCLFADAPSPGLTPLLSILVGVVLLISGAIFFRRAETRFADYI